MFNDLVLAIPKTPEDNVLDGLGRRYGVTVFAGSENDLVERYYQAAIASKADVIVRLPADNGTPEPSEIDRIIKHHLSLGRRGFSSNLLVIDDSGYPGGIGAEVFDYSLLSEARERDHDPLHREHVHLNFFDYSTQMAVDEEWCPVSTIMCPSEFRRPDIRLDVNTIEEYEFMRRLYEDLYPTYPNKIHSYGNTYCEHREFLEFSLDQHKILKQVCEECNIIYSSSVWDLTSAKEIASINPEYIKIPSASNTNFEMLEYLCESYSKELHISMGMTTRNEEKEIVELLTKHGRNKDAVIYSCTSGYPVPDEDVCLLEIRRLKDQYGDIMKGIGFSGHHKGIALDVGAYVLGAQYIERHFTLDRTWKGTDHAASLEPDGMRRVVRNIGSTRNALNYESEELLVIEEPQRKKLKWNRFL